jgi:PAS domain S-box-containing protein
MPGGTHFCLFYETQQDLLDTFVPYFIAGLENNECCIWVVSQSLTKQDAIDALRQALPDLARHLAQGSIDVFSYDGWYLQNGVFNGDSVIRSWKQHVAEALAKGYSGMRLVSDNAWLSQDRWETFSAYEQRLDESLTDQRIRILCAYPTTTIRAAEMMDVARTHQFALAKRNGHWEIFETPANLSRSNKLLQAEIIERNQVADALRGSKARLQAAIDAADIGLWDWNLVSGQIIWLGHHAKLFGYAPGEFDSTYRSFEEHVHPDDLEVLNRVVQRARDERSEYAHEYRVIWPDSSIHWIAGWGRFVYNDAGEPIRMYGAVRDSTERKRSEGLLDGQKRVLEMIASTAPLSESLDALMRLIETYVPGMLGSILLIDEQGVHLRHGAAPSLPGDYIKAIDGVTIGPSVGSCGTAAFRKQAVFVKDIAADPLWEDYRALALAHGLRACWSTPIFDAHGRLLGTFAMYYRQLALPEPEHLRLIEMATHLAAIAISRDRAQTALCESEAKLKEAQRIGKIGYWEHDLIADRITCSEETGRIFRMPYLDGGMSQAQLEDMTHPDDRQLQRQALSEALQGSRLLDVEFRIIPSHGNMRFVHVRDEIAYDESGRPIRMFGTVQDITERKQAEEELRRYATRLQELSRQVLQAQEVERRAIARELHDEIGQVLNAVSTNLQTIQLSSNAATLTERLNESVDLVDEALRQIRDLSLDLRPSLLDDFGLVPALAWFVDRQAQRSGFSVEWIVESSELRMPANLETTVFRVVQIALTNVARHAQAKHVHVELRQHEAELELVIRDDGIGFDVGAALERASHGATLGLLSMQERVRLVGGALEMKSTPGLGTEIRARFPVGPKDVA